MKSDSELWKEYLDARAALIERWMSQGVSSAEIAEELRMASGQAEYIFRFKDLGVPQLRSSKG
jgi:hypothetical protein